MMGEQLSCPLCRKHRRSRFDIEKQRDELLYVATSIFTIAKNKGETKRALLANGIASAKQSPFIRTLKSVLL
jgi:hypothetical protein